MIGDPSDKEMLVAYFLRLGDNAIILAQQLGAWVGHGPELEEEMAMANFALDYVGQSRMLFSAAGTLEGKGRTEDDFAYRRDSIDYTNAMLVEQPNGDFAQTIARQFLFESFYSLQLAELTRSSNVTLAEIAAKVEKEIRYHLRHCESWVLRLGDGTNESHTRMQSAFDRLWCFTGELFAADSVDVWASGCGVGPYPGVLYTEWQSYVSRVLNEATLTVPKSGWMASGGKQGRHSEHHGYLLAEMQFLQRAYPGQSW